MGFPEQFRVPTLLRWVKEGEGLISISNGGPRFFMNFDNYYKKRSAFTCTSAFNAHFNFFLISDKCYHFVDPSPLLLVASLGVFLKTSGGVLFIHSYTILWLYLQ